jgi:nucleoside-diphosphate-sugar epimerase
MKRLFITGATGFVGCRLAEVACHHGIPVVALVRNWSRAARLARLPVRIVSGNILDLESLRRNMKGCDAAVHCAVDNNIGGEPHRRSTVLGTANVMQAALETKVKRVIHLSSIGVYSYRAATDASTEDGAYRYSGDSYCDGKIDAEKTVLRYWREFNFPVTVLRPTIVYGPFGFWTEDTIRAIRQKRMALIEGGSGICNTLYVDNLVQAIFLAAQEQHTQGEIFHISDSSVTTWKEFIEAHARALGDGYLPLPEVKLEEIAATQEHAIHRKPSSTKQVGRLIRDPQFRQLLRSIPAVEYCLQLGLGTARALLTAETRHVLREMMLRDNRNGHLETAANQNHCYNFSPGQIDLYTTKVVYSTDKVRQMLDYHPRVDFARGMELTSAWMKWARL